MRVVWICSRLCAPLVAAALLFPLAAVAAGTAPNAVVETGPQMQVSLGYFMERLGLFGQWLKHPVWGDVWQPEAGPSFRPYFYGYWEYTDEYGWFWVSNEPYGEIVYHYGRWVFDPDYGWLWLPGYVWGPSWVVWRENDTAIGWLPMPPGYADFDQGAGIASYAADGWYGYQTFYGSNFVSNTFYDLWVFVGNDDFGRSDRRRYVTDHGKLRDHFQRSHDGTRYLDEHDRMVDRSIDIERLRRQTHHEFDARGAARFLRRGAPITSVSEGREIFRRERDRDRGQPASASGQSDAVPARSAGRDAGFAGRNGGPRDGRGPDAFTRRIPGPGVLNPGVVVSERPRISDRPVNGDEHRSVDRGILAPQFRDARAGIPSNENAGGSELNRRVGSMYGPQRSNRPAKAGRVQVPELGNGDRVEVDRSAGQAGGPRGNGRPASFGRGLRPGTDGIPRFEAGRGSNRQSPMGHIPGLDNPAERVAGPAGRLRPSLGGRFIPHTDDLAGRLTGPPNSAAGPSVLAPQPAPLGLSGVPAAHAFGGAQGGLASRSAVNPVPNMQVPAAPLPAPAAQPSAPQPGAPQSSGSAFFTRYYGVFH